MSDPIALRWQISAISFFNVFYRPTFPAIFGGELFEEDARGRCALREVNVRAY
ncbi:hypothetical protein [Hoeflea sp.]|uniref:hypothetical protein n=1 Tax=Hoeflea sp. TaxID=1940281 RepID=UPI003B52C067